MKKVILKKVILTLLSTILLASIVPSPNLHAGGTSSALLRLSSNKSSASANGSDAITLTIHLFGYECNGTNTILWGEAQEERTYHPTYTGGYDASSYCAAETDNNDLTYHEVNYNDTVLAPVWRGLSLSGSGVSFSPSTFTDTPGTTNTVNSQITSTVAGTKTITVSGLSAWAGHNQVNVTFNPVSTTNTTNNTSTRAAEPTQTANATAQTTAKTAPAAPILKELVVGDTQVTATKIDGSKFNRDEKKVFSGKTIPNGIVHLYFHSDPFDDTVTADKDGNWTYELTKDIGEGDHTLQIAVTDPETKLTSAKSTPTKFALVAGGDPVTQQSKKSSSSIWFISAGIAVTLLLAGGFVVLKKKLKH